MLRSRLGITKKKVRWWLSKCNEIVVVLCSQTTDETLQEPVRVACLVLTTPKNIQSRAIHVKATWGKRCNILVFFSSEEDNQLPAINTGTSLVY